MVSSARSNIMVLTKPGEEIGKYLVFELTSVLSSEYPTKDFK